MTFSVAVELVAMMTRSKVSGGHPGYCGIKVECSACWKRPWAICKDSSDGSTRSIFVDFPNDIMPGGGD